MVGCQALVECGVRASDGWCRTSAGLSIFGMFLCMLLDRKV